MSKQYIFDTPEDIEGAESRRVKYLKGKLGNALYYLTLLKKLDESGFILKQDVGLLELDSFIEDIRGILK